MPNQQSTAPDTRTEAVNGVRLAILAILAILVSLFPEPCGCRAELKNGKNGKPDSFPY